jgi:hypothetical protein
MKKILSDNSPLQFVLNCKVWQDYLNKEETSTFKRQDKTRISEENMKILPYIFSLEKILGNWTFFIVINSHNTKLLSRMYWKSVVDIYRCKRKVRQTATWKRKVKEINGDHTFSWLHCSKKIILNSLEQMRCWRYFRICHKVGCSLSKRLLT